ncbi:MAG: hypothetical protein A2Z72_05985 [Omnitrophica bacterium RBG_13_46_9]|nr:MAG: hypothetical protein A2Z72_05985 [Omnitrophica bacterium RBG_13_46_9]
MQTINPMPIPLKLSVLRLVYAHPLYARHLIEKKFRFRRRFRRIAKCPDKDNAVLPPLVYKFILTLRCNLNCRMCMLWGERGWCKKEPRDTTSGELDWDIVKRIVSQSGHYRPSYILSGGEPLLYSHFEDLAESLGKTRSFAYICTNGLLLDRFKDTISKNPYLTFLVSLDGLRDENDSLRGKGVYDKVVENISLLKAIKRPPYIGIQFTIYPDNVAIMYDFCREMARLKIDWILLNPCWFISETQAKEYESVMVNDFGVRPKTHSGYLSVPDFDKEEFVKQLRKIRDRSWPMQVSCYLKEPEHVYTYADTPEVPPGNGFCYKQWLRLDIAPDGEVCPCIQFPDLKFGNLKEKSALEIWNSPSYERFRKILRKRCLPVCSKCDCLYLYDAGRKYL